MYIKLKPLVYSLKPNKKGKAPILAILKNGDHEDSSNYIKGTEKKAYQLESNILTIDLANRFDITKILKEVQTKSDAVLPVKPFNSSQELLIKACIDEEKDIDNFTGESKFENCTVEAVREILKYCKIPTLGTDAVIVGAGIGWDIASELKSAGCTITVCDSKTKDLASKTRQAEILVSAAGQKNLITSDMVKDGAIVLDVGLGDIAKDVAEKADVTPIKDGVGAITTAILFKHLFEAAQQR